MDPAGAAIGASCTRVLGGSLLVRAGRHGCGRAPRLGHPVDRHRAPSRVVPSGPGAVRGLPVREELDFGDSSDDDDESKEPEAKAPENPTESSGGPPEQPAPPAPPVPTATPP